MKITTENYNNLTDESCLNMIDSSGELVDEVVIFGFIRMKIYSLHDFYVQAVFNKNDDALLDVKALISEEDWQPYMETLDLKDYFID